MRTCAGRPLPGNDRRTRPALPVPVAHGKTRVAATHAQHPMTLGDFFVAPSVPARLVCFAHERPPPLPVKPLRRPLMLPTVSLGYTLGQLPSLGRAT